MLAAQAIQFESGRIQLPENAPWIEEYVREITSFPGGKHDDQVDSTSPALEYLAKQAKNEAFWAGLARFAAMTPYETC
jgi:phage terminase large subunit-like protein